MASNGEQVKEKKRNAFRFLTNNSSLEIPSNSATEPQDEVVSESSASRMRRMLFRRSRSETTESKPVVEGAPQFFQPTSPPPPSNQASSSRSGSLCPPSYDEAIASTLTSLPEETVYCTCRECQERCLNADEEEQEDNCAADAVFPMETHVLMQEVLADGMAFCVIM